MSFSDRIEKAKLFEKALIDELGKSGFYTACNGTEHTFPEFTNRLRLSNDPTSLAIRFQPDGVACLGNPPCSFYFEAKCSRYIERTAYEQYMNVYNAGNILVIIFEWSQADWRWNFIEDIHLVPGLLTVAPYPADKRWPVIDGWVTPRNSARWNKIKSSARGSGFIPSSFSGTSYRKVKIASLLKWNVFKSMMLRKLENDKNHNES